MRAPPQIEPELRAAIDHLASLREEMAEAVAERREAIIKSFDDGMSRDGIAEFFAVPDTTVTSILCRAGRTEEQRRRIGLTPAQCAHYDKLLRQKIPSRVARQIAEAVAS